MPAFIIRRLPVRLTYDNNYFNDLYQGIPIGGYTQIVEKMLASDLIDVENGVDFFDKKDEYLKNYPKVVFTGMIDQFFGVNCSTGACTLRLKKRTSAITRGTR